MMALPSENGDRTEPSAPIKKPLVLLAGNASSLALLNTNRCTRKASSAAAKPTVGASWDLYRLIALEFTKIDPGAKLPTRR